MVRLTPRQRAELGETLRELANLSAGAWVLGQFVGPQPLSWASMLAGAAVWLVLVSIALVLPGE